MSKQTNPPTDTNSEPNLAWDNLIEMRTINEQLMLAHAQLMDAMLDIELMKYLPQKHASKFNIVSSGFARDFTSFNRELNTIRGAHLNKTGSTTTPDDLMFAFVVFEQYTDFALRLESNLKPLAAELVELMQIAEKRRYEVLAAVLTPDENTTIENQQPTENKNAG